MATQLPLPRTWPRRLLVLVGLLLVLAWAAPIIAGYTPLVGWACRHAERYIDGSIQVGGASLGWFSPIVLCDVTVRDRDSRIVAQIPRVEGDRSLLMLLVNRSDLGSFRLEKAKIDWVFRGKQSNLETLWAKFPNESVSAKQNARATTLPRVDFDIVDATLRIDDADTKQHWQIRTLSVIARLFRDDARTIQLNVQGTLHDGQEPGSLKVDVNLHNVTEANIKVNAKGKFASLPLPLANLIARRYQPGLELAGSLQGKFTLIVEMKDGKPHIEAAGELVGNKVGVRSPLLADHLRIDHIIAPGTIRYEDGKLSAERFEVRSDFGKATLHGTIDLNRDLLAAFEHPGFELALDVNLATIADRLPKTLHLHSDLRMTAGNLRVNCNSVAKDGALVWQGKLHTTDVRGMKRQQMIAWSDPITLEFQVRDLHKGVPLIDHLKCTSRFLNMQASSVPERFTLTAEADLGQLAEPLGQFIDLTKVKLAGRANAAINVRHVENDRFEMQGVAQLRQINLAWLPNRPWQEASLSAVFDARGQIDKSGRQRIETGGLAINLGADLVVVKLTEPIVDLAAGPWGAAVVRVNGDLARWQQRARGFTTLFDDWQVAGAANLQTQVRASSAAIECADVVIEASNFVCIGSGLWIYEPTVNLQTAIRHNLKTADLEFLRAKLNCPTVRVDSERLALQTKAVALRGSARVSGDVARVRQWTQDPKAKPGESMTGAFAGKFDLDTADGRIGADFDLAIRDLVYGPQANATWREPELKFVGRGVYDLPEDVIQVEKLTVSAAMLGADAKGKVANVLSTRDLEIAGMLTYDLANLEPRLRAILGKDVKISGKDTRPFVLTGPLHPTDNSGLRFTALKGNVGLHWKSLKTYGCDIGAAELKAIAQQGWLQFYPIETTLNGGKMRLQPNIRIDPDPTEVVLLAGPVIEKAQITPAMCAGALGYAMPALANVAEAEGAISLTLESGRIPLAAPTTSEVKGTFVLHTAKIGPSAIVRELSGLFRIPPPTSLMKECRVPFHMVQGKVHHRDLELVFPDFTLKSSGSVGLDGSLALIVETSIPNRLADAARFTPAQKQQLVRIPVGGTIERPRLDPRALESLTAILGRSVLENQLNKLLQPKR